MKECLGMRQDWELSRELLNLKWRKNKFEGKGFTSTATADIEDKFKKISFSPGLEKVPILEEEIKQVKISWSQELMLQRPVLETRQENQERDALTSEKDKMRKMKEKFKAAMRENKRH